MRHAQLVRDRAELLERVRVLAEHPARPEADGVHHEVRVYMRGVNVRGDDHLAVRPRPRRELSCDLVRQLRRYVFAR